MSKVALIINPESGKGRGLKFANNLCKFSVPSFVKLDKFITNYPKHAIQIAKDISNKYDRILIAGGDGTLNEFINGFDINSKTPIGLIPIGSGNDFALALDNPIKNITSYLNSHMSTDLYTMDVDIGSIELTEADGNVIDKKFVNSLGIGFDARVAYLNQSNKFLSGSLSYITAIIRAFFDFNLINYSIENEKVKINKKALFCSIGNGETVGGGLYLMPGARIDDEYLDLSVVDLSSRLKLIKLLPKAMKNQLKGIPYLSQSRFKELDIKLQTPYYTHVDGEIVSLQTKRVKVKILTKMIKFIKVK
ncbi:MAG: YegS/Rv2252/BmrU family lipid kinase [Bacteroidota bacterium]